MKTSPISCIAMALAGLVLGFLLNSCAHRKLARQESRFLEVKPLLEHRCLPCHNSRITRGGLDLETRPTAMDTGLINVADPPESRLLAVVLAPESHPVAMPPTGHGLTETEILALDDWIRDGAPWPDSDAGRLHPASGAEPRSR